MGKIKIRDKKHHTGKGKADKDAGILFEFELFKLIRNIFHQSF